MYRPRHALLLLPCCWLRRRRQAGGAIILALPACSAQQVHKMSALASREGVGRPLMMQPTARERWLDGLAAPPRQRLACLDLLRGLIMAVMAWDHTREGVTDGKLPKHDAMEMWSGGLPTYDGKWYLYISRAISHFCMPGFFYLMGIGMALFSLSRMQRGWGTGRILKHFAIRGALLVFFGRVVASRHLLNLVRPRDESKICSSHHSHMCHGKACASDLSPWLSDIVGFYQVPTARTIGAQLLHTGHSSAEMYSHAAAHLLLTASLILAPAASTQVLTALGLVMLLCSLLLPSITSMQGALVNKQPQEALVLPYGAAPGGTTDSPRRGTQAVLSRLPTLGSCFALTLSAGSFVASNLFITAAQGDDPTTNTTIWPGSNFPAQTFVSRAGCLSV